MSKDPLRILIAEWIPSLNKGELAILKGMLRTFKILGRVQVAIFSFLPSIDKERYPNGVRLIDVKRDLCLRNSFLKPSQLIRIRDSLIAMIQHFVFILLCIVLGKRASKIMNRPIWREYCESDAIIICHDGVPCVEGYVLDFSPVYITLLAKALKKPIVIYANGATMFNRRILRILARYVLRNANLVTIRDEEYFRYLEKLTNSTAPLHLAGDPALLLVPAAQKRIRTIMAKENIRRDAKLVGVAISHEILLSSFQERAEPVNRYECAVREIAAAFDEFTKHLKARIIFIPHCVEPYHNRDDRIVAKNIVDVMRRRNMAVAITNEYSPEDLKGLIGEFDLFIGTRVHSVVSALSMGIPSCTITCKSDRRAYGLIGKLLRQERWIYSIENLSAQTLFRHMRDLLSSSAKIRKELPSVVRHARQKALLNGRLLKAMLDSISSRSRRIN